MLYQHSLYIHFPLDVAISSLSLHIHFPLGVVLTLSLHPFPLDVSTTEQSISTQSLPFRVCHQDSLEHDLVHDTFDGCLELFL